MSSNKNPMGKMILVLSDDEDNEGKAWENLVLCESMAWKIKQFLVSIGQADPEDKILKPRWNDVEGAKGLCKVKPDTYEKDGETKEKNVVVEFLPPGSSKVSGAESKDEPNYDF